MSTLSIKALSTCLVVFLFNHGNAQCFVRQHDCSYGLKVSENVVLEGAKEVKLLDQPLKCKGVEEESSESWILDYGILKLSIENKGIACIMTYTTTEKIAVGGNESTDALVTTFPSFQHPSSSTITLQGRLSWGDSFMNPHFDSCQGGIRGGPCVLYDTNDPAHGPTVMFSALDNFLITTRTTASDDTVWGASTIGTLLTIPAGFSHSFVALVGHDGVTDTINEWGTVLQKHYNLETRMHDPTITTLGYQTDNGAQYCRCHKDCDTVLLDEIQHLQKSQGVPVRYLSFQNAWWRTSGSGPWCVSEWDPNPVKMPHGVQDFSRRLNHLPLQFYSPYLCTDTKYRNSTNFTFFESNSSLESCSEEAFHFVNVNPEESYEFYKWFFSLGMSMGMTQYELDFVDQNINCVDRFQQEIGTADLFFEGMSTAASDLGIPVQWCYATPSAILQSLLYPGVTNFRASYDYYGGGAWNVGFSSLLVWAVQGAPSTDTFWTSDNGDVATTMGGCDSTRGCPEDHGDTGCELHTLLAVMSTGPVGFSDAMNYTNAERILRTCRSDGVLLRPNKPITAMDATLGHGQESNYKILQTYSGLEEYIYAYYIVAHHLVDIPKDGISIPLLDLWPRVKHESRWFVVWNRGGTGCTTDGADVSECGQFTTAINETLSISSPTKDNFETITVLVAAVCPDSDWVLVGELSKYVSVSTDRFSDVECLDSGLLFNLHGAPNELVNVTTISSGRVHVHTLMVGSSKDYIRVKYGDGATPAVLES